MENQFCRHEKYKIISEVEEINICKCLSCSLIFAIKENFPVSKETYKNYYKEGTGSRFNFGIEYIVRAFRLIRAMKIFFIAPSAKSILDIGSGRGWMLYYLKKYFGYESAMGTQISAPAYEFSKEKLKLEIYNRDLLDIDFKFNFDVITLWHVLEHVSNPEAYLDKIHALLVNKGILVIEVPNFNSWTRRLTKNHWLAWNLKYHLTFFTISSLTRLLGKHGFKVKKIRTLSLEYSTFTSVQSIVNFITDSDDYFFQWLQAGNFNPKIILHSLLFVVLFPACLFINLALFFSKNGEVINVIAQKNE